MTSVCVRLCVTVSSMLLFVLMALSSDALVADSPPFSLHVRMSVVSLQVLVFGLVLLAYHGCVFLYNLAGSRRYRNLAPRPDDDDCDEHELSPRHVITDSPVSQGSVAEETPQEARKDLDKNRETASPKPKQSPGTLPCPPPTSPPNSRVSTPPLTPPPRLGNVPSPFVRRRAADLMPRARLLPYVMFAHCAGVVLWLTLFYIDFYDPYATTQFVAGALIAYFLEAVCERELVIARAMLLRVAFLLAAGTVLAVCRACFVFDIDAIVGELETEERFTLIEDVLPVVTGFAWVLLLNHREAPDDLHAAVGTSVLLCLPALVRTSGSELRTAIEALGSSAWAVLFVAQPMLKFLCAYVWVVALSTRRTRLVISSTVLGLALIMSGRCVMEEAVAGLFYACGGALTAIEVAAAVQCARPPAGRLST